MKGLLVGLATLLVLGCSDSGADRVTVDHNGLPIQPDQVVTLAGNAFGCKFKSDLIAAVEQYRKGEYSAWARTTGSGAGGECFNSAKAGLYWTIYEIDYPLVSVGFATVEQYEAAKDTELDPRGVYWVPSGFVYAAKETEKP